MTDLDRRSFLKYSGAAALGAGVSPSAFAGLSNYLDRGAPQSGHSGYGPLYPTPDRSTGEYLLSLPRGFRYRSISLSGEVMSDGNVVPGRSDGMGAVRLKRTKGGPSVRMVRNHEVFFSPGAFGPLDKAYDDQSGGGTTTLDIWPRAERVESWMSLNGTNANCAGGVTPWGTWITCEETPNGPDANVSFLGEELTLKQQHGFLFEVPYDRGPGEMEVGVPIRKAGRFAHEAAAVDPHTGYVYTTEDNFAGPSGFYRYRAPHNPMKAGRLHDGGRLEVLSVSPKGSNESADLTTNQTAGVVYRVRWVPIEDPDPTFPDGISNDDAANVVITEGISKGAAIFSRLEGLWYGNGLFYFTSTHGGGPLEIEDPSSGFGSGFGQVWAYDPQAETLTMLFESPGPDVMDFPDNLTVSPQGSLLLCEDGDVDQYVRGLTLDGELFDFALNTIPGQEDDEFAGATFAGGMLFLNIQASDAWTFAIWGPWRRGPL